MRIRIPGSISCNSALMNLKRPCDSDSLRRVCISGCIATLIACIVEELKEVKSRVCDLMQYFDIVHAQRQASVL